MWKKLLFILGIAMMASVALPSFSAAATYKNDLPRAEWTKFGVNPWRLDTDNDGYSDSWEVKNAYCPTNAEKGVALTDTRCQKGTINFTKQTYSPPATLKDMYPRVVQNSTSCSNLQVVIRQGAQERNAFFDMERATQMRALEGGTSAPISMESDTISMESGLGDSNASAFGDFSGTNVQVEGVDEGDTMKTDGKYVYYINNNKLFIAVAAPAAEAKLLSTTVLKDIVPREIYVAGNQLVVVGSPDYYGYYGGGNRVVPTIAPAYSSMVTVQTWQITDRAHPKLIRTVDAEGSYLASRLTNGYVYVVLRTYPDS